MPHRRRWNTVVGDSPELLEVLAAPYGTHVGVAVCRPVPGATSLAAISVDLLCALGKTEALTQKGRVGLPVAEEWLQAHLLGWLFVVGADGLDAKLWRELCSLGERCGFNVVFVSANPARWIADLAGVVHAGEEIWLRIDPERQAVLAPVGTALPDVGFPALPAACAALLDPEHAARAQAIYDECLVAAFDALAADRLLERGDADHAFRCALGRVPDHSGLALATHALRAAGILRGYHISFTEDYDGVPVGGVAFDDLLTAERLAQLGRLLSPEAAAAGILAGMPGGSRVGAVAETGASVMLDDTWQAVPAAGQALVRAWARSRAEPGQRLCAAPARHRDRRHRALYQSIPPAGLRVACEPIACGSFRMIGDPPMNWARPPLSRPRRGPAGHPPAG
jgi:hypothetical protein